MAWVASRFQARDWTSTWNPILHGWLSKVGKFHWLANAEMEIGLGLPAMTDMLTEDNFALIFALNFAIWPAGSGGLELEVAAVAAAR